MAETPDKDSKTEEATEKRREDALDEGNTPISRELTHVGFVFALVATGGWMALGATTQVSGVLTAFIERPGEFKLECRRRFDAYAGACFGNRAAYFALCASIPAFGCCISGSADSRTTLVEACFAQGIAHFHFRGLETFGQCPRICRTHEGHR